MTVRSEVRVGVIGFGYWGPNLVRNLHLVPGCRVRWIADYDPKRLELARGLHPSVETMRDGEALIARPEVDAVVIVTPISSHYALARKAMESGKDVLVAKPITASSREALDLIQTAARLERILMVDHTFVYSGAVRKIKELIEQRLLGDLYYFDSVRVNLGVLQSDVNVLWDLAPHDLSILDYLLGEDPTSISAVGAAPVTREAWAKESIAHLILRYRSGLFGHVHVNWLSPIKIRRTLIGGSVKMVVYDHLDLDNPVKIYDRGVTLMDEVSSRSVLAHYRIGDMFAPKIPLNEALEVVCRHFIDCVRERTKPMTDGASGLRVVRLLELAQESLREGGRPIEVSFGEGFARST